MSAEPRSDLVYDPASYQVQADPFPIYARMQDEAPVYRNDDLGFWALTRFEDVFEGLTDHRTLSSAKGTVIETIRAGEPPPDMMIFHDKPRHDHLRGLVSRAFTPRRVAQLEPRIRAMCSNWLDPLLDQRGGEIVSALAGKLPMAVIGALLGAPEGDFGRLKELSDRLLHREDGSLERPEDAQQAGLEMFLYYDDLVAARRANPGDDMISALLASEMTGNDGERRQLDDSEVLMFCILLGVAGNETTSKLIATGTKVLSDFPDQRARLVADPSLWPGAVEELLRFDPPSHYQGRVALEDHEYSGQTIHAGEMVLLVNGAANRDPRMFDRPHQFIADRSIHRHLAFGWGIHTCLGAALARLETRIALQELTDRFPNYVVDEAGVERLHSSNVRGLAKVPFAAE